MPGPLKIDIYTLVFPPDQASTAHLVGALVEEFTAASCDVSVFTCAPHYGTVSNTQAAPFEILPSGARIHRQSMASKSSGAGRRLASWFSFSAVSAFRGLKSRRADVALVISPPLFVGLSAALVKVVRKTPYVYVVQEAFADIVEQLQILPKPAVSILRVIEGFIYRQAAGVVAISPAMARMIERSGVPSSKIRVIENFPLGSVPLFPKAPGEWTASYLGNVGPAQDLDTLVEAARILKLTPWQFVVAGNGTGIEELRTKTSDLPNFAVLEPMDLESALALTASSSVGLVLQSAGTGKSALPSKLYQIMSLGIPVAAVCDQDSGVAESLRETQAGFAVLPGDAQGLAQSLENLRLGVSKGDSMGQLGKSYVEKNANRIVCAQRYLELLHSVAKPR
jgi:glycosyltransferase involved in cell wall biosynthesis